MAGVSVESCQFVVLRSPRGRLGSVKDMRNRLRRMRGRFPLEIHLPRCISSQTSIAQNAKVFDLELSGEPQAPAHAVQGTTRSHTHLRGRLRADQYPQKVTNLDPMAPSSRQKRQLPEAPQ